LAIRILVSTPYVLFVIGERARTLLAATRFADVRWVAETGSTNADALELARAGEPEGIVLVADHQTAGRGRQGRTWTAPPGASLLATVLLRPPSRVASLTTTALGLAAVDAIGEAAGVELAMKWPNDLVWAGAEGDRKLAGILAEADWPLGVSASSGARTPAPDERLVVAAGIGINVVWPGDLPDELEAIATAINHITGREIDREDLLVAMLQHLDRWYGTLLAGETEAVVAAWRTRLSTLGREVRVDLGTDDVVGTAVDVTDAGHLVVRTLEGTTRTFAAGDVIHLR
jgi:BirA family biotin operon repressor/biotin-[acetyl-CoA-carboxylase] ligase